MLSARATHLLRASVLASLGLLFYSKIANGTLSYYINLRFAWLSLLAAGLFILLAMSAVWNGLAMRQQVEIPRASAIGVPIWLSAKRRAWRLSVLSWGVLLLPLLFGALVPARPLGAGAVQARGISRFAPERSVTTTLVQRQPSNILDWLREFARSADLAAFSGKAVDVSGFVYRDPRNRKEEFWVSRFVVSCCVADAAAIGLLVRTEQAATWVNDMWVRVRGRFGVTEFAGERIPIILAEEVHEIEPPSEPYLYP